MENPIRQRLVDAFSKIVGDLKKLGFDPYIDVDKNYVAIILPSSQFADLIYRNINMAEVRQYINLEVKETVAGNKGYIVIKATYKMQGET